MNKRLLALLSVIAIVGGACSPVATSSTGPTAAGASQPAATTATTPIKLTVWARNYTVENGKKQPWAPDPKAKLEAAHPGLTIELSGATSGDQFNRIELSQAGAVEDKPDIFQLDNIWLGQFVDEGITANLDSYYANWADKSDIVPAYANSTIVKGSQYAVWFYSDIRLMVWNKDVFKKAGLDPEKGPTTWDELFADAAAIKAKVPGVSPVEFPASSEQSTVGAALPPLCAGCQAASTAGGWMLAINADSPNKDLAWDYLTMVTDGKNMVPFEVDRTRIPVRTSGLAEADAFKADPYFAQE